LKTQLVRAVLFIFLALAASQSSFGQLRISVSFGPPALPVYDQPPCPADDYIWIPGYWAWDDGIDDYYWVPGTWVLAPEPGFLWTPPYWAWTDGAFVFYDGYWGPHVGFYGGIDYGFGYFGEGFDGGRWQDGHFFYNRTVVNVNVTNIRNVYTTTVVHNETHVNRVSYNGGSGGVVARPTAEQESAMREKHLPPVAAQQQHVQGARGNPELRATANHGKPPVAATAKPGQFSGKEALAAREAGGTYNPPADRKASHPQPENNRAQPENQTANPVHPNQLPPIQRSTQPNTGNAKLDQKYQQQQDKLQQKQQQEREKLQSRQDQEHQQLSAKSADASHQQQTEQRHQQQTQQLQQRQQKQWQQMQQKQQPARSEPKPPKRP